MEIIFTGEDNTYNICGIKFPYQPVWHQVYGNDQRYDRLLLHDYIHVLLLLYVMKLCDVLLKKCVYTIGTIMNPP